MKTRAWLVLNALLLLPMAGCNDIIVSLSSGNPVERVGRPLQVGDYLWDFEVYDAKGRAERFTRIRGDVTILAILPAAAPGMCEVLDSLRDIAVRSSGNDVDVEYVSVFQPPDAKPNPEAKITLCPDVKLWHTIAVYDEGGKVRFLYGPKTLGAYYIIDDDDRIAGMGDVNDLEGLKKALDKAARKAAWDNCIWNEL